MRGHYLFREVNRFPRAKREENCEPRSSQFSSYRASLSENCSLLGTLIMSADKYPSIFSRQMKAIVYFYIPQFLKPMDSKHNNLNLAAKICSDICP